MQFLNAADEMVVRFGAEITLLQQMVKALEKENSELKQSAVQKTAAEQKEKHNGSSGELASKMQDEAGDRALERGRP